MDINKLYSAKRTGIEETYTISEPRTEYQKDFDRLIFSSPFRRLQNKTQVFPLPGSVFVHNRLTHSLEVASVGRSLGHLIGHEIFTAHKNDMNQESKAFYQYDLYNVIASACLCHDIGNPAFGHSGEDAIASFFQRNETDLKPLFTNEQWNDFIHFEGNANAIRVLTQHQTGKAKGGLMLTYSTLCSIAKYPCESTGKDKTFTHRKKFGFFQTEKETFQAIASQTSMQLEQSKPLVYKRHPFVWLVETADDICYNIIDLEDAHRLGIISFEECEAKLMKIVQHYSSNFQRFQNKYNQLENKKGQIAYLRAKVINYLIQRSKEIYKNDLNSFLDCSRSVPIYNELKQENSSLDDIQEFSKTKIYNHRHVVEIENAGYNVMYELLHHFIPSVIKEPSKRKSYDKKAIKLIPPEFLYDESPIYNRVLGVLDYISGMTDNYATDLYKRIKGIEIGMKI